MTTRRINGTPRKKHEASVTTEWWRKAQGIQSMKHLTMMFLLLFLIALSFDTAKAQTRVNVCQADLYFLANRIRTKVVLVRDTLVFVDEAGSNASFSIDRTNILRLNEQSRVITIHTRRPVWYRSRESRQFDFEFVGGNSFYLLPGNGNCDSIAAWLYNASRPRRTTRATPPKVFWATLKRGLSRDIDGKLEILEKVIAFKANREAEYTYRWDLRAINNIERKAPYVLEIKTSNDDKFKFELQNRAISPDEVYAIRNRIARLRLGRNNMSGARRSGSAVR
jgi:hypothetical protein